MTSTGPQPPEPQSRLSQPRRGDAGWRAMVPYLAPMLVFLVLTSLERYLPDPTWFPLAYSLKIVLVTVAAWASRSTWSDLRPVPPFGMLLAGVVTGLIVFVLWVGLEGWYPELGFLGKRTGIRSLDVEPALEVAVPRGSHGGPGATGSAHRGAVLAVVLDRWVIDADFWKVPVGQVTPLAAGVTSVAFGLSHPEWLPARPDRPALGVAALANACRLLLACLLSHAVANLALGVYVLATGAWKYLVREHIEAAVGLKQCLLEGSVARDWRRIGPSWMLPLPGRGRPAPASRRRIKLLNCSAELVA